MLKLLQGGIWFVIIPIILGMIPTHFIKSEKNNILYSWIMGYFIKFAILQIIAIPMIFADLSLDILLYTFCTLVVLLLIFSIIINRKNLKEFVVGNFIELKKLPITTIAVIIIIGLQAVILGYYTHIDDDDSFYVATATTAVKTNTLYKYTALEGYEYEILPSRYVLSPYPMYNAIISKLINIHPAIVAHTIFPIIFIPLAYCVYALIANKLFKGDKKSVNLFLIILSVIYIWGNYSIRSNFSFLLMRIWQGKSVLSNIMLPMIMLVFYDCIKEDKLSCWITLFITMISACLLSEMGIAFSPMILGIATLILTIRDKKISYLIKSGICCLPCIVYLAIYLIIR